MIRKFLKEYAVWYSLYVLMTFFYLATFFLSHLPLDYFWIAFWGNVVILLTVSLWLYLRFRAKIIALSSSSPILDLPEVTGPIDAAYQEIIELQKEVEASMELASYQKKQELQAMVKMLSHQMKVPLAALSLMVQTHQVEETEVQQQVLRLEHYLNNLLTYIKFDNHADDYRFEAVDVRSLLVDLIKKYRIQCVMKQLSISLDGELTLVTDAKWLSFALGQILDNAIKYSQSAGVITIELTDNSMSISDQGIGILDEDIPRLFDEGFTGFNGHEHRKATGLGLYMTKQVLDQLHLAIEVKSQIEQGTTVILKTNK